MKLTRLKLIRLQQGRLQIDVAAHAAIPRPRLSELENGHVRPKPEELARLALALRVPAHSLLDDGRDDIDS